MRQLGQAVRRFLQRDDGPTAVEYGFMAFLVIVICFIAVVSLGQNTNGLYQNNASKITNGP